MAHGDRISKLIYYYAIYLRLKFIMLRLGSFNAVAVVHACKGGAVTGAAPAAAAIVSIAEADKTRKMVALLNQIGETDFRFLSSFFAKMTTMDDDDAFARMSIGYFISSHI